MLNIDKETLIKAARKAMEVRISSFRSAIESAREAHKDAPDARQSWSDTTRSQLEGLIGGLSQELNKAQRTLEMFNTLELKPTEGSVETGSLVRATEGENESFYLIVLYGGGTVEIPEHKTTFQLISIKSPVGQALCGHKTGDRIEIETPAGIRKLEIKQVQ